MIHDDAQPVLAEETVTLSEVKVLLKALAKHQSLLLLSAPGVGKSDVVAEAAAEAGLPLRSLLGTQIAPEDVSGVPRIVGERSVFCPPRVLLPENPEPFCLFLDELPACAPDVQKALYSLLLERRIGEHKLPAGTWVVAAGNRQQDRALVRAMSSALCNRVLMLHIRVDVAEWLAWASRAGVRSDVRAFIQFMPDALHRSAPAQPVPFSTPRSWALLSQAIQLCEQAGALTAARRRALAFGRVSAEHAAIFCAMAEEKIDSLLPIPAYFDDPSKLPTETAALWFLLCRVRSAVERGELVGVPLERISGFLRAVPIDQRLTLLLDLVPQWAKLGAEPALLDTLQVVVGG